MVVKVQNQKAETIVVGKTLVEMEVLETGPYVRLDTYDMRIPGLTARVKIGMDDVVKIVHAVAGSLKMKMSGLKMSDD